MVVVSLAVCTQLVFVAKQTNASTNTRTFNVSNTFSPEEFTVPQGVTTLQFTAKGGVSPFGGFGAVAIGSITVTPGEVLRIYVGGPGSLGSGGYPNGGDSGGAYGLVAAYGGGGSTHIVTADMNETPIVVAGGGGGGTNFSIGGAGGHNGDDAPVSWITYPDLDGNGGTQSAGGAPSCTPTRCEPSTAGSFMMGGHGYYGAGGGGGYFGGSGGFGDLNVPDGQTTSDYAGTGGGGSSYVDPTRLVGQPSPAIHTGWSDVAGSLVLAWTVPATTTTVATTTTTATTTIPPTTPTFAATTTAPTTTPPTSTVTTTTLPSWTATPAEEDEEQIVGSTPFPVSGVGSVVVTNETGFTVSRSRVFTPRWRTRVYVGTFSFSLKASYMVKKKRMTYSCTFPRFSTEARVNSSNKWRWYQPPRGCILPKDLIQQLSQRKATMTFAGTFTRRWATTGKSTRPDGSRINVRRINVKVAASESVALN